MDSSNTNSTSENKNLINNRYEIKKLVGWGAHGEVYQAIDIKTNENIAIKIFYSGRENVAKYVYKELASLTKLSHPNLLPFKDFGECEWKGEFIHYIVTPYMEGGNLAKLLQQNGALEIHKAVDIAIQIAEALSYMHQNKHYHRDVKPSNILIDKKDNVVLADFSISSTPNIPPTDISGTPEYSAPEQLTDPTALHPTIDIYGLGVTLYEMLCGINPFKEIQKKYGAGAVLSAKYDESKIPLLNQYNKRIPQGLSLTVHKMISADPQKRFQLMEEVIQALVPYASPTASIFDETTCISDIDIEISEKKKCLKRENIICKIKYFTIKKFPLFNWVIEFLGKITFFNSFVNNYIKNIINFILRKYIKKERIDIEKEIEKYFEIAGNYRKEGDWKDSWYIYKFICFIKKHPRAYNYQGDILIKLKKYKKALKYFDKAILINPTYYSAYCNRGFVYTKLKKLERGILDYEVAIALDNKRPQAYFYKARGWLEIAKQYLKNKDFYKASEIYKNIEKDLNIGRKYINNYDIITKSLEI